MKIKITANPITTYGDFSRGQIITDEHYPLAFLNHLVDDCGAAERLLEYETKVDEKYEAKKKNQSTPSSQPAKALKKKMSKSQIKRRQLSRSMTHGS